MGESLRKVRLRFWERTLLLSAEKERERDRERLTAKRTLAGGPMPRPSDWSP